MRGRDVWISAAALIVVAGIGFWAYRYETRAPADACQICQRTVHRRMGFHLETPKGRELACCPRCGMHQMVSHPGLVREAWATDLSSGVPLPAKRAYYVEGGDVEYCTIHETSVQRAPPSVSIRAYDRCLPTLVAFVTARDAEAYRRQHGGRVLTYDQALESVKLSIP